MPVTTVPATIMQRPCLLDLLGLLDTSGGGCYRRPSSSPAIEAVLIGGRLFATILISVCSVLPLTVTAGEERSSHRRATPVAIKRPETQSNRDPAPRESVAGTNESRPTPSAATPPPLYLAQQTAVSELKRPADAVQLDFGSDVSLKAVVDYVRQRLDINILYDEQLLTNKVNIRSPGAVPVGSLLALLQSALKMNGLALEDAEVPGWKRIVQSAQLPSFARLAEEGTRLDQLARGTAVTQTFLLKHVSSSVVDKAIKPFLSGPGANSLALEDQRVLIVTDFVSNLTKISKLVALIDREKPDVQVRLVSLNHAAAAQVASHIATFLAVRSSGSVVAGASTADVKGGLEVTVDERTNRLVVVGVAEEIAEVVKLARSLDVPLEITTKVYEFEHASVERINELIQKLIDPELAHQRFNAAVDSDRNQLFVTASSQLLQRIDEIVESLDKAPAQDQGRVRFYKLQNVTAADLLVTLRSLEGESIDERAGDGSGRIRGVSGGTRSPFFSGSNQQARPNASGPFVPGPNRPTFPGRPTPNPPAYRDTSNDIFRGQEPAPDASSQLSLPAEAAKITADESSNTLIIVADPEVQRVYAELIRALDQRRAQVLIEAHLVILDTSDDFTLGVETSVGDTTGSKRLFAFSSFGLSNVDAMTGALSLIPGTGFNGTLVDPEVADVVIRALTEHRRSHILSAPRLLVSDNALGVLTSVEEEPFESVNASNTVATTSFAGFAEAGTTIEVIPHISGDGYLQLEYRVILNTFTGTRGGQFGEIPPPRKTDEISSVVTIPDGHTVIVGGLNQRREALQTKSIPFIERIPIVRFLGGQQTQEAATSSLFVFIRPIILRDDKFQALKYLSRRDVKHAGAKGDYPPSQPLLIK